MKLESIQQLQQFLLVQAVLLDLLIATQGQQTQMIVCTVMQEAMAAPQHSVFVLLVLLVNILHMVEAPHVPNAVQAHMRVKLA